MSIGYVKTTITAATTAETFTAADTNDRLLELPAIELEEKVKHELEENPALEEGKPNQDDYEYEDGRDSDDEGTNIDGNNNENADLSLGDYLTEDDIPDYKLQELHDRNDKKEDIPFQLESL